VHVLVFLQGYHLASIALSGMLKQCLGRAKDVATVALPDQTCPSFHRQLMLGVGGDQKPDPYVKMCYRSHPLLTTKLPTQRH